MAIVGALIGGWFLNEQIYLRTQHHPLGVGFLIGAGIAAAFVFYKWQEGSADLAVKAETRRRLRESGEYRPIFSNDPQFRPDRSWVAPVAILAVLAVFGFQSGYRTRDNYVRPYCLYGAQSDAQYDGCMSHVIGDEIDRLDTQAARFGRGETSDCLDDSGPFCADASRWNSIDPSEFER